MRFRATRSAERCGCQCRFAVFQVVCVLVGLEKQHLQLQHVRRAVGHGEREASLAQQLVLLELAPVGSPRPSASSQISARQAAAGRCAHARWLWLRALRASH
eukprot:6174896-Pleurochrysis_carterae.AAC.1